MAIVSVRGQTGGALVYTRASLAGSQSSTSNAMSGTGRLKIIKFWISAYWVDIYTDDDGATWKILSNGASVSFPLSIADRAANGLYYYTASISSISGSTVTYVSYKERTSTGVLSNESLNYVNVRI